MKKAMFEIGDVIKIKKGTNMFSVPIPQQPKFMGVTENDVVGIVKKVHGFWIIVRCASYDWEITVSDMELA